MTGLVMQLIQLQHNAEHLISQETRAVHEYGEVSTSNPAPESLHISVNSKVSAPTMPACLSPILQSHMVINDELAAIKLKSPGLTAFASALFRKLFTMDEMKGRNCHGLAKKGRLDENKINHIQEYVYKYYPDTPEQLSRIWARCTQTIDSYIRNKVHKAKNI